MAFTTNAGPQLASYPAVSVYSTGAVAFPVLTTLTLFDIGVQRVEVLKGPQGHVVRPE